MYFSYNERTRTATILLKVKAGARERAIHGFIHLNGTYILKISINAIPEDGKANNTIIKMLADIWNLKQNQLEIVKGLNGSSKLLAIKEVEKEDVINVIAISRGRRSNLSSLT